MKKIILLFIMVFVVALLSNISAQCTWTQIQAEDGSWNAAAVETEHSGYTGTGYVNTENAAGNWVEVNVNVPTSGSYDFEIRFANGSSERPAEVTVNGSTALSSLSLPGTGSWTSWTTVSFSITLSSGNNAVRFIAINSGGLPNVDRVDVCIESTVNTYTLTTSVNGSGSVSPSSGTYDEGTIVTLTATPASGWQVSYWSGVDGSSGNTATVTMNSDRSVSVTFTEIPTQNETITLQENETGFCAVDGEVESEHSGYTGSGYANTDNATGNGIDYKVNVGSSGTYTIEIRYAATSDRPANLIQNGTTVASNISMPSTGAWTTWTTATTTADLSAGESDLRLEATESNGLPNIDYLAITGESIDAADCNGSTITYILTTSVNGSGSVSPSSGTYDEGTVLSLTATPSSGWQFDNWSGDASGSSNPLSITINSDLSITANFSETSTPPGDIFSMVGFATQTTGTTGGTGGTSVTVSSGDDLQDAIDEGGPRIIYINGTITSAPDNKINVKDVSDITIVGVGTSGVLNGVGIKIWRASNIIIRNLRIHHVDIGDKDCIGIEGPSDHIWIDHCELYNEFQGVDQDYYDGLLDAKSDAEYITYSWNYLHDSWKTGLAGSSESDDYDRKITFHHNWYRNCNSRLPLYRGGVGHIFNCYYQEIASTAINSRINACLRVENNYFVDVNNPWVSAYSDVLGGVDLSGNILVNSPFDYSNSDINEPYDCTFNPPYSYTSILHSASDVPSIVQANVGVGKLSDPASFSVIKSGGVEYYNNIISEAISDLNVYPNPFIDKTIIGFDLKKTCNVDISIYDMTGKLVDIIGNKVFEEGFNEILYYSELSKGVYLLKANVGKEIKNFKIVIR